MEENKEPEVQDSKIAKWFVNFKANLASLTPEQKSELRDALEVPKNAVSTAKASNGIRITGKVIRTETLVDGIKMPKQMKILVDCLPKDKAIGIEDWGKLAVAAGMETQQPAARIAAYYKKPIVEAGLAKVSD